MCQPGRCAPRDDPPPPKAKATTDPAATPEHGLSPRLIRARPDAPFRPAAAWALVTLCTASFYLGPLVLLSPLFVYFVWGSRAAGTALALAVVAATHPVRPWPRFRRWCQCFYDVFDFHHNMTPTLNEIAGDRLSIVAVHPHAIIPLHGFIWGALCDQILPDLYGYGCTTDGALYLPVLRHVLQFLCVGSASKRELLHRMQRAGQNLYILAGGVAEIFLSRRRRSSDNTLPNTQTIKARRYGLMKLSLETGAAIRPVFVFGASDVLDQLTPVEEEEGEGSSKGPASATNYVGRALAAMSRRVRGGLTLYYGRWYLPIPHAPRLSMVMGDPIYPVQDGVTERNVGGDKVTCTRIANPSREQVEELLDRYTDAMHRLFEQYKEEAGYPNETLRII